MKALRFEKAGDLTYLEVVERPVPQAGSGEALVRVRAAGLNKSDTSNVLGLFKYTTLPRTPGRDFAGVVEAGPPELIGKAVYGSGKEIGFTIDGSHAGYLVVPAAACAIKPEHLSFEAAAACGVPFVTAWYGLENTRVGPGTRFVVIGAAGAVGCAAIHLGRVRGAEVVGAVRRPDQAARLEARGFRALMLPENPLDLAREVQRHFPDGADVIYDTAGYWLQPSIAALANFGRVAVIVVHPRDGNEALPIRELYRRGASIVGVNSLVYPGAECARMLDRLRPYFESGQLVPPDDIDPRPLSAGPSVYAELRTMAGGGKFVLIP